MRGLAVSLALIGGMAVSFPAMANTPAPAVTAAEPTRKDAEDPTRIVCTREHVVGSNRPKKVCMTVAKRNELRDAARRAMDEGRRSLGRSVDPEADTSKPY